MDFIEEAIVTLGIPGSVAVVLASIFAVLQIIGELIELFGKHAPKFLKLRKVIQERREFRRKQNETLQGVQELLQHVHAHYSADNIAQRNAWMNWVNERAAVYDATIVDVTNSLNSLAASLDKNTLMTEKLFIESSRDRIIDFAYKVANPMLLVSREEFNRIFKVYDAYEEFLAERHMTNGEVEVSIEIIRDAYRDRLSKHNFIEDVRAQRTEE